MMSQKELETFRPHSAGNLKEISAIGGKMDSPVPIRNERTKLMNTSDLELGNLNYGGSFSADRFKTSPGDDEGYLADRFIENLTHSPLGRLLSMIGSLPEIRREKVDKVKTDLRRGIYDLENNLDMAIDRVIEELLLED